MERDSPTLHNYVKQQLVMGVMGIEWGQEEVSKKERNTNNPIFYWVRTLEFRIMFLQKLPLINYLTLHNNT